MTKGYCHLIYSERTSWVKDTVPEMASVSTALTPVIVQEAVHVAEINTHS